MELPGKVCDLCQICNWARTVTFVPVEFGIQVHSQYLHFFFWF